MSLIAELRRRSVFKVGAAYLVVAWLIIQAASIAFPTFEAPAWALRVFIFVVLLGFPVALVLAWTLEVTPDGVRVDKAPVGNARMYSIVGALALLAVGWYFKGAPAWREDPAATAAAPDAPGGSPGATVGGAGAPVAGGVRRLAVLPLANFSPDPNNAFFADGLHDDMLTALSRLQGVEVISRTTMQTFKGSTKKLAEIADEISATHVIEGSVRRDATRVRLTVQLIDPRTDGHIWAETYDRPLDDSLDLQTAVAKEVAAALKVAIDSRGTEHALTASPAAYDLYLKALLLRGGPPDDRPLKLLDAALVVDPAFSKARALRATFACAYLWWHDLERVRLAAQAAADIAQVRREAPDEIELAIAEATYTYYVTRDYPAALAQIEQVVARDPSNAAALAIRAALLRRVNRLDEARAGIERVLALDPNNVANIITHAQTFMGDRKYAEAMAVIDDALRRIPADSAVAIENTRGWLIYASTGDRGALKAALERVAGRMAEDERRGRLFDIADPTPERLAYYVQRSAEMDDSWGGFVSPVALDAAIDADHLGDAALARRLAAQAETMLATLDAESLKRDRMRAMRAQVLALLDRPTEAIAEAEAALKEAERVGDPVARGFTQWRAAYAFARAGAKPRAIDQLESLFTSPYRVRPAAQLRDDAVLRRMLAGEARYQALMQRIDAEYRKP